MKPTSPTQLARLLDQVAGSYPYGIPLSSITTANGGEIEGESVHRFHFIVVGEPPLSKSASELLEGITSKGLRITKDDYSVSFSPAEGVDRVIQESRSPCVLVFGEISTFGFVERPHGAPALISRPLEVLSGDTGLKKELWRNLQTFLAG